MRCIVLAEAKSGATLLALVSDKILMGPLGELGPMDPIVTSGEEGIYFPARAYTNFIEEYIRSIAPRLREMSPLPMFPLRPEIIGICRLAVDTIKAYGIKLASSYNLKAKSKSDITDVMNKLVGGYPSHGYVIDIDEARRIGLNIDPIPQQVLDMAWKLLSSYLQELRSAEQQGIQKVIIETEKGRRDLEKARPTRIIF